jgi:hypothetical protein
VARDSPQRRPIAYVDRSRQSPPSLGATAPSSRLYN